MNMAIKPLAALQSGGPMQGSREVAPRVASAMLGPALPPLGPPSQRDAKYIKPIGVQGDSDKGEMFLFGDGAGNYWAKDGAGQMYRLQAHSPLGAEAEIRRHLAHWGYTHAMGKVVDPRAASIKTMPLPKNSIVGIAEVQRLKIAVQNFKIDQDASPLREAMREAKSGYDRLGWSPQARANFESYYPQGAASLRRAAAEGVALVHNLFSAMQKWDAAARGNGDLAQARIELNTQLAAARAAPKSAWSDDTLSTYARYASMADARRTSALLAGSNRTVEIANPRDRFVGVLRNGLLTQSHLVEDQQYRVGKGWVTAGYRVSSIDLTRGNQLVSSRHKDMPIKNQSGDLITDLQTAKHRVRELLENQGISTLTDAQAKTGQESRARKDKAIDAVIASMPKNTQLKVSGVEVSTQGPNRFTEKVPEPRQMTRGGFNRSWFTSTNDGKAFNNAAGILVPNIVYELGLSTGSNASITVQPACLFVPYSFALPGFSASSENKAWFSLTNHPAGFYPGDTSGSSRRTAEAFQNGNPLVTAYESNNFGFTSTLNTKNWGQSYYNAPIATSLIGSSANVRLISERDEVRAGAFSGTGILQNGGTVGFTAATPYSWLQKHIKCGVSSSSGPYCKGGLQAETGFYALLPSTSTSKPSEFKKPPVFDTHIVNGAVVSDPRLWESQFADIEATVGLKLKSESVRLDWNDRSASVYVLVPPLIQSGWASRSVVRPPSAEQPSVKLDDLANLLQSQGARNPSRYKELKWVTPALLRRLNPDAVFERRDPSSGRSVWYARSDAWLNLGVRLVRSLPGLFMPDEYLR